MRWLKHAFAVDPPGPAEPEAAERELIDRMCAEIVRRGMTTPALFFLESLRPLQSVGAQALHFLSPFLSAFYDGNQHRTLAGFLERRGAADYICTRLEQFEARLARPAADDPPAGAAAPATDPSETGSLYAEDRSGSDQRDSGDGLR